MVMWFETITSERVVLANGEYEVEFRVSRAEDREHDLPEIFRNATIQDNLNVRFSSTEAPEE